MAVLVTIRPGADPDLFARVAVGRLIEVTGGVTDRDPFPFTTLLDRWIDHEWLSGVVFYQVARLGGDWGLVIVNLLLMSAMVVVVVRAQKEYAGASLGWSLLTLVYLFGAWSSFVRSRAFTLLGVAILLLALVRWRNGRTRWIWLLPPIMVVWANAHGGFVAGLGLLGAAALAVTLRTPRKALALWACLGCCVAATFINPYGLDYWGYILSATTRERPVILEWQTLQDWQVATVLVLGAIYVLGAWVRRRDHSILPETLGLLLVSVWATLDSQRLLNFLLLVLAVYGSGEYRSVVAGASRWIGAGYRSAARQAAGAAALLLSPAMVILLVLNLRAAPGLDYEGYPVGAVEWLHRHGDGGRLLTHFNHGSYALWRLYPLYQVAIDGRYEETYPEETVELAALALQPHAPGHADALQQIDPDYIVVPGREWAADFGGDWRMVYSDSTSAVLARPGLGPERDRPPRGVWVPGF
jgi:hypothetical protein